jgi:hypothetical protein
VEGVVQRECWQYRGLASVANGAQAVIFLFLNEAIHSGVTGYGRRHVSMMQGICVPKSVKSLVGQ